MCAYVCVCVCAPMCWRDSVCLCVAESGVWILSSCLSDRKASSVKQRSRQHQSVLCLISAALHIPLNTEIHISLRWACMLSHKRFVSSCTTHTSQTPFYQKNTFHFCCIFAIGQQDRCIFQSVPWRISLDLFATAWNLVMNIWVILLATKSQAI